MLFWPCVVPREIPGLLLGCDYNSSISSKSSCAAAPLQTPCGCSLVQSVPSGIFSTCVERARGVAFKIPLSPKCPALPQALFWEMIPGAFAFSRVLRFLMTVCNTWEPLCQGDSCPTSRLGDGFLARLRSGCQSLCFSQDQRLLKL